MACHIFSGLMQTLFGDCVYGKQDAISLLLGYCSILLWLNAQLPQLVANYKSGSADGLSLNFLSIWLAGDSANLIGSLLTHQLPFQLYLGVYFVSIDICLLCQWTYYNKIKAKPIHEEYLIIPTTDTFDDDLQKKPANTLFQHPAHTPVDINSHAIQSELTPFSSSASPSKWYTLDNEIMVSGKKKQQQQQQQTTKFMGMLLFTSTLFLTSNNQGLTTMSSDDSFELSQDNLVWIGRVFAWSCTCLYLMSRIPQLLKNRRRQSVEGLSASLFVFAVGGNLTYASSILSHPGQTVDSLLEALPYLIGSAGTLMFDFSIFCQFLFYKKTDKKPTTKHNTEQIV
ncbi:hypothetical protein INT47_004411 [Mucor saturninus]|uniref:PQ-loop-domain-containing protein n=1 Tax=Mucor saturninus TaxID=64648 RepID=A0A8H7QZU7_9FUNG|nr:hypothetical protein INT47_004411 [Mucor saturninus]